ncbi:MAG: adenosylcobinamide-phosphate synthase CbiB [Pseudomonadota bacterium]
MSPPAILFLAFLLDAALGEPRALWSRVPHPAVIMGRAIAWADKTMNAGVLPRLSGVVFLAGLVGIAGAAGLILQAFGGLVEVLVVAILLAHRSLMDHVSHVSRDLRLSIGDGRRAVAMIVGRDTKNMDQPEVARAAIESAAENFSDGVIAPAFWFLVAGLPGIIIYKAVNTADSMVGYRTSRYEEFGWASARFDDVLNWIPARLTAFLLAVTGRQMRAWRAITTDARLHRSPNAGWPEAALARTLDIGLAGPRSYNGQRRDFPFVHTSGRREIGPPEIDAAIHALWQGWFAALGFCALLTLFA